jgi:hypothetical protein
MLDESTLHSVVHTAAQGHDSIQGEGDGGERTQNEGEVDQSLMMSNYKNRSLENDY